MRTKLLAAALFATLIFAACSKPEPAAPAGPRTIALTAGNNMQYNLTRIEAAPGEEIHVTLTNVGTLPKEAMGHDWVLLKPGSDAAAYARAALQAKDTGYQPPALDYEVIASIPVMGPQQTGEVTFRVPAQPGDYPYLCSFPAHFQVGMHGVLAVK